MVLLAQLCILLACCLVSIVVTLACSLLVRGLIAARLPQAQPLVNTSRTS